MSDIKSHAQQAPRGRAAACSFPPRFHCAKTSWHHRPHSGLVSVMGRLTVDAGGEKISLAAKKDGAMGRK